MSSFDKLPPEIKQYILKFLSHQELFGTIPLVSKELKTLSERSNRWQKLLVEETGCTFPTKNPIQAYKILKTIKDLDFGNFCTKLKTDPKFANDFNQNEISALIEKINLYTVPLPKILENLKEDKYLAEIFLYTRPLLLANNVIYVLCLKHELDPKKFVVEISDSLALLINELRGLKRNCKWHWGDLFALHCNQKSSCYVEINIDLVQITISLFNPAKIYFNDQNEEARICLKDFANGLAGGSFLKKTVLSSLEDLEVGQSAIKTGGCRIS